MPPICTFNLIILFEQKEEFLYLINANTAHLLANPGILLVESASAYKPTDNPSGLFLCLDGFVRLGSTGFTVVPEGDASIPVYSKHKAQETFAYMANQEVGAVLLSRNIGTLEQPVFTSTGTLEELNNLANAVVFADTLQNYTEKEGDIFLLPDDSLARYSNHSYQPHTPSIDMRRAVTFRQQHAIAA